MRVGDDFDISSRVRGKTTTNAVKGELDSVTAPRFVDEVTRLVSDSPSQVASVLEDTTFVDLSALRRMMEPPRIARALRGGIVVHASPRSMQKVPAVAGTNTVLVVH